MNISAQTGKKEKKLFSVLLVFHPQVSPRGQYDLYNRMSLFVVINNVGATLIIQHWLFFSTPFTGFTPTRPYGAKRDRDEQERLGKEVSLLPPPSSLLPRAWSRALIPFPFPFECLPRRLDCNV